MQQQTVHWSPGRDSLSANRTSATAWARVKRASWEHLALGAILLLAAFLNLFRLDREGYGNTYYAATVKSMLTSWHNFFFVSFDPGGFVSVDKPPLGFWIQALSAKIFGFSGLSLLLPEAIAGVLSVTLLYHLVRRVFGGAAGLLAALVLAVTPITVAVSRNNTIDALLMPVLLGAVWSVMKAIERGSWRWLILTGVLVGLGFNIKMMQAFLVVPALGLAYLLGSRLNWRTRFAHLAVAGVVLAAVSLSWATAVDLTSASQRPYVGSSSDNSALNLALGYNGLFRLLPSGWLPSSLTGGPGGSGGGFSPFGADGDSPSALRLFNHELAGQIAWLLPLAVLGGIVAWRQTRTHLPLSRRHASLVLWGGWLVTGVCFFSVATSFTLMHRYYLAMLAPPLAALVGIGLTALWRDYRHPADADSHWERLRGWLLPIAVAGTAGVAAWILRDYPGQNRWLTPYVLVTGLGSASSLAMLRWRASADRTPSRLLPAVAGVALVAMLTAPTVWAGYATWQGNTGALPAAGPTTEMGPFGPPSNQESDGAGRSGPPDGFGGGTADAKLITYLDEHWQGETFLFATTSSMSASPYILATGQPVAALGGFSGGDPIVTPEQLAAMVRSGTIRYFLVPSPDQQRAMAAQFAEMFAAEPANDDGTTTAPPDPALPAFGPGGGQSANIDWITTNCTAVPESEWQSTPASTSGPMGMNTLYDCADAR
ncbi:MAG: glycosyltransferase family 39 protein [Thermomicrobiales bacterium]